MDLSLDRDINDNKHIILKCTCNECNHKFNASVNKTLKDGFLKCPACGDIYAINKNALIKIIDFFRLSNHGGRSLTFD